MTRNRRQFLRAAGVTGALSLAGCIGGETGGGSTDEVVIGTLTPLSGPFSLDGTLVKQGVDFAAQEINENGGIESMDGAEINVVSEDTGESTDSATSAAQDLYAEEDPSAAIGSWLSSQTLATTSVSERQGVPQLTLSFSDEIVQRGYDYAFQTSPKSSEMGEQGLARAQSLSEAVGSPIEDIAMVGDNTAAIEFTFNPLRETFIPETDGVELTVDEVWSPTLSDATPIVRELKEQEPDMMFFGATAFTDAVSILNKMEELDVQMPMIGIGAWLTLPAYVENVGPDRVRNIMAITGSHPLKGQEESVRNFTEFSGEPFMTQDSVSGYAHAWLVKQAIEENGGDSSPQAVRDTLSNTTFTEGPAVTSFPLEELDFQDNGHLSGAQVVISQWQDRGDADYIGTESAPFTVFPEDFAVRDVEWVPAQYS